MYYTCSVHGCNSVRKDVYLHRFPVTNEERLKKWLQCLGGDFRSLSLDELKNNFVCHKHFEKRFLTKKNRLLATAYPTLFTNAEITMGIPSLDFEVTENISSHGEHSYCRKRHLDHNYCKSASSVLQETQQPAGLEAPSSSKYIVNAPGRDPIPSTSSAFEERASSSWQLNAPDKRPLSTSSALRKPGKPSSKRKSTAPVTESLHSTSSGCKPKLVLPTRTRRSRLIQKLSSLSPQCKVIYTEYLNAKRQVTIEKRAKKASKFSMKNMLEKLTKNMNPFAKKLLMMQIHLACKKEKGRRFTNEEKLIALSIMKQSPKAYRFLQKIFILPSKTTLNKFISTTELFSVVKEQPTMLMEGL